MTSHWCVPGRVDSAKNNVYTTDVLYSDPHCRLRGILDKHRVDEVVYGVELIVARFDFVVEHRRKVEITNVVHVRHLDVGLKYTSPVTL